jgi:hypothetical protein
MDAPGGGREWTRSIEAIAPFEGRRTCSEVCVASGDLRQRKLDGERRAATRRAFHGDPSTGARDDVAADREAEACSDVRGFRGEERGRSTNTWEIPVTFP